MAQNTTCWGYLSQVDTHHLQNRRLVPCGVNGAFDSHPLPLIFLAHPTHIAADLANAFGFADGPQVEFINPALQMAEGVNPYVQGCHEQDAPAGSVGPETTSL